MKNTGIVFICLLALSAHGAISKPKIKDLLIKGEKGAAQCNKVFDKVKAMDKNFDYGLTFPNKKAALQVVQILSKSPGTPPQTKELMDRLVTARASNLDYKWLAKEMDRTLVCDPMALNLILTKLVRSSRTFKFTLKEKRQMAKVILNQLRKEAEFPTHLGLLAPYVLILDSLVDQRALVINERAARRREELRAELNQGLTNLKSNEDMLKEKIDDKAFQTKNFIKEVRENEAFRVKFLEFIDTL